MAHEYTLIHTNSNDLCYRVLGAAYEVGNTLGGGFLEKVYERALLKELHLRGIRTQAQVPMKVNYKGEDVGDYFADLLVEDALIVELKCVNKIGIEHVAQCLNYLKATDLKVALILNFRYSEVGHKRVLL